MYSIQKSDMDLRKMLYQNIVLSGGSTLFKGFGDRLLQEIKKNVAKDMKIRVSWLNFYILKQLIRDFLKDCCTSRTTVLDVDGRFDSGISGHLQENVDIETRVWRRRPACRSSENILEDYLLNQGIKSFYNNQKWLILELRQKSAQKYPTDELAHETNIPSRSALILFRYHHLIKIAD